MRLMQPPKDFTQIWAPLVGDQAADVLWRATRGSRMYSLGALLLAVAASFGGAWHLWLGVLLFSMSLGCVILRCLENAKFTDALSDYFDVPIGWLELDITYLTPKNFARACERKGWSHESAPPAPSGTGPPVALRQKQRSN